MTQENTPVSDEKKNQISSDSDVLLSILMDTADVFTGKANVSITLFVHGLIVTGVLIGEKTYFDGLYDDMNLSSSPEERQKEAQMFLARYQSLSADLSGNQEKQSQSKNIEYIHLKDAQFYAGNSLIPNNKKTYWRGSLSRVDGFSLGNLFQP